MKKRLKTKGWTLERREAQRLMCLNQKPWEKATGPQSDAGKIIVSQNAYKHGGDSVAMQKLSTVLTAQARFLDKLLDSLKSDC